MVAFCCLATPALANDSSSELTAGGIVLTRNDAITMQREDLTLAPDQVTVRYEMRNDTGKPVTLRVAFPLPDIPVGTPGGYYGWDRTRQEPTNVMEMPHVEDPNYLGFSVRADGKALTFETDIRADMPDGRNIVNELRRIGGWPLVLRPAFIGTTPDIKATPDIIGALRKLRAIDAKERSGLPLWTTRVTLHWMQTFKPGVTIVEHRYRPVLGFQGVSTENSDHTRFDADQGTWNGSGSNDLTKDFCLSGETETRLRDLYRRFRASVSADRYQPYGTFTLGYILRTARNWAGPIRTFHLTIKSGVLPHESPTKGVGGVAACTDFPLQETAPHQWEATVTNYVPTRDLRVLLMPNVAPSSPQ